MLKRNLRTVIISILALTVVLSITATSVFMTYAAPSTNDGKRFDNANRVTTITGLKQISIVGSTAFIVDATGHTIATDPNPYGVAIAPPSVPASNKPGTLKAGDIIVSNIGAADQGNTIVRFPAQQGPGHLFNNVANAGTKGPSAEAFNTTSGTVWIANSTANNVQIFKPDGTILATITNPLLNHPWGQAYNHGVPNKQDGAVGAFFSTNEGDGTIDRIDIIPVKGQALPMFKVFQIGQVKKNGAKTKMAVTWLPSLKIKGAALKDVLLAIDPANSRIAAFPQ